MRVCAAFRKSLELRRNVRRHMRFSRSTLLRDLITSAGSKVAVMRQDLRLELCSELKAILTCLVLHDALKALGVRLHGTNAFCRLLMQ